MRRFLRALWKQAHDPLSQVYCAIVLTSYQGEEVACLVVAVVALTNATVKRRRDS